MEQIRSYEPLTAETVKMIGRTIGGISAAVIGLGDVDLSAGAGKVDSSTKCIWDSQGRRITLGTASDGGIIASRSNEPDQCYKSGRFA